MAPDSCVARWLSHKYATAGLTRDGGTVRTDLHPFRRRSPTEQRLGGRVVTVVPRLNDAPHSRGFCATATAQSDTEQTVVMTLAARPERAWVDAA
jgi:hypothetical protein